MGFLGADVGYSRVLVIKLVAACADLVAVIVDQVGTNAGPLYVFAVAEGAVVLETLVLAFHVAGVVPLALESLVADFAVVLLVVLKVHLSLVSIKLAPVVKTFLAERTLENFCIGACF